MEHQRSNTGDTSSNSNFRSSNINVRISTSNYTVLPLLVEHGDFIYTKGCWTGAPIVLEEYKLVFFTQAKVASTTWDQLFRRMMGFADWSVQEYETFLPWNPDTNGLKYLYDYDRKLASHMMTAPNWTRAIFVRDPKERFVSAFLDKALRENGKYIRRHCCQEEGECVNASRASLQGFLDLVQVCQNEHWNPQAIRMEDKYWPYINFVGHMETLAQDAERLLRQLGVWEKYGESGWGTSGRIFQNQAESQGRLHATNAKEKLKALITPPELEDQIEKYYERDYRHPVLGLSKLRIHNETQG